MTQETTKKKLIEVSLPLETINREASHEKSVPRKGHPATMHLYWARRPITAARAILFAQLVDDPSSNPDKFPTEEEQVRERSRLHSLIERLCVWENSNNEELMAEARQEILNSNGGKLPSVLDPFAGGGTIPLEAQRLGLHSFASDLNPVSVLLNKALIEIPSTFTNLAPVYPGAISDSNSWQRAQGLAEDVRRYGDWVRTEAENRIGHLYPKAVAPGGTEHTVIAWVWARTVVSPNPANPIRTPLVRSWWLSTKKNRETYIHPFVSDGRVQYEVRSDGLGPDKDSDGTIGRRGGVVVGDQSPMSLNYVREQAKAGKLGTDLMAVVAEGDRSRLFLSPDTAHVSAADVPKPENYPDAEIAMDKNTKVYGLYNFSDLFTNRQLTALTTFSDLVKEARSKIEQDALIAGLELGLPLEDGGDGAAAYADAVCTYLAFAVSKLADWGSSLCSWIPSIEGVRDTFARQALPMVWDFVEINPFSNSVGNFGAHLQWVAAGLESLPAGVKGQVEQADAATRHYGGHVISTDPPYYDNIMYSDLSDYFYIWLRNSLGEIQGKTLSTLLTPKADELVAHPARHNGKAGAEKFFVEGFNSVFARIRETANPDIPLTVYYAYKQQDSTDEGSTSTGWHTLLNGLIKSGWEITATWPMRSERGGRMISVGTNALASSILLACRPRSASAEATTRKRLVEALKAELPEALRELMQGEVAPVDLAQAAIGPGISVFSRYSRVREADGTDMSVKEALLLINATLDEVLNEQESDFDSDTRFAVKWYKQFGWDEGESGIADQLARSSDTSIGALERGGVFEAKAGKARLLPPRELNVVWDPATDDRISVWECVVRLAGIMERSGADAVAGLLPAIQKRIGLDPIKELGFLLFHEAEKKADTKDAILFNGLVGAWGDLREQARQLAMSSEAGVQMTFDFDEQGDS